MTWPWKAAPDLDRAGGVTALGGMGTVVIHCTEGAVEGAGPR